MKPVRKLPTEVSSLVRSGVIIPTPAQALVELVFNSIDAGATSIAVRADLRLFKIQVIDNGNGISFSDLQDVGNRSITSKCYTLDEYYNNLIYHGFRGEALASLREMCGLLEIITRPTDGNNTYSKLFIHGKEENVKISELKRPAHGTTVTVTDFMFNMPVRQGKMKEAVEWEIIRSSIEYIALAHPEISITVRNDTKGRIILEKHKSSNLLCAFEHLFGHNLARTLAAINYSTDKFKVTGYISKEAYRHNDLQFIYVNRQPIMKTKLHKLVTVLLSKSSILRTNGPWKNKPIPKNVPVEKWLSFPSLENQKKFAVFVINIECARVEYEMCWDSKQPLIYFKDWDSVISCVSDCVQQFLRMENLVEEDYEVTDEGETKNGGSCSLHYGKSHISHEPLVVHDSSSKDNPADIEVETWDMHGTVHGIIAKRPRASNTDDERKLSEEDTVQNVVSSNQVENQFLTPDACTNNEKFHVKINQNSVAPVVKFLEKYKTPVATRLNITKGAYRLKMMEDEEKKIKIARKLGNFKFSNKPKLNSLKNCQGHKKPKSIFLKSTSEEKKKTCTLFKNNMKKIEKEKLFFSGNTNECVTNDSSHASLLRRTKDKACCFNSESFDSTFGRVRSGGDDSSEKVAYSFTECVNSPEYINDSSLVSHNYMGYSRLRTTSIVSNCVNENISSLAEGEQFVRTKNCEEDTSGYSSLLNINDSRNTQSKDNICKSCMTIVNPRKHMLCCGKSSCYFTHNTYDDEGIAVNKHGDLNLHPFDVQFCHGKGGYNPSMNAYSKRSVKEGVSRMTTMSIPTAQSVIVPNATLNVLEDNNMCRRKSVEDQVDLCKYNEHICSSISPLPVRDESDNLFIAKSCRPGEILCNLNNSDDVKHHSYKKNVEPSFLFSEAISSVNKNSRNTQLTCSSSELHQVTHFHVCKKSACDIDNENRIQKREKVFGSTDTTGLLKDSCIPLSAQKVMNRENIFEPFEKYIDYVDCMAKNRSPYFIAQTNSEHYEKIQKSLKPKCVCNNVTDVIVQGDSTTQPNRKQAELPVFEILKTNQNVEKLTTYKDMNREINRKPLINFTFSECSPIKPDSQTLVEELMSVRNEPACDKILSGTLVTETSNSRCKLQSHHQVLECLKEETDNLKWKQLSNNELEEVCKETEGIASINKEFTTIQQFSDECEHIESDCSVADATEHKNNSRICEHNDLMTQKGKLCDEKVDIDGTLTKDWLQLKNLEGKLFYFHAPSGFTSYNAPVAKDNSSYLMSKRFEFMPKGMSPLLSIVSSLPDNCRPSSNLNKASSEIFNLAATIADDLKTVKWRNKPDAVSEGVSNLLNTIKPLPGNIVMPSNSTIPDLSFISAKMSGLLHQQKFDKRIFENIQVIGQLDNKFIVTLCSLNKKSSPHILGMFDQHAVHERIRLESLTKEYTNDKDGWSFTTTDISEPITMAVSSKELHVMGSFQDKFEKLGLHFIITDQNNVEIQNIPTCLYTRFLRERSTRWLEMTLHILIQDVVQFLIKTNGQDSVVPEVFKDVINSEACKGAIKFGDPLSIVQCEELLSSLNKCNLPFYCAHGRPSFMPIFDLRQFEIERRKCAPEY